MSPRPPKVLRTADAASAVPLREHLISAAEGLLAERSPGSLTTRDIARAARVSDGVLYNHFADKDDLVLAAVTRRIVGLSGRLAAALPAAGSGEVGDNLMRVARAIHALHEEAIPLLAGLLSTPHLLHGVFNALHAGPGGMPAGVRGVMEYLAAERDLGRIDPQVDPGVASRVFFGAIMANGIAQHITGQHGGRAGGEAALGGTVAVLLHGLAPAVGASRPRKPRHGRTPARRVAG